MILVQVTRSRRAHGWIKHPGEFLAPLPRWFSACDFVPPSDFLLRVIFCPSAWSTPNLKPCHNWSSLYGIGNPQSLSSQIVKIYLMWFEFWIVLILKYVQHYDSVFRGDDNKCMVTLVHNIYHTTNLYNVPFLN